MLRNYKALPLQEVKDLYARCAILADKDDDINSDFYGIGRPTVYRLLAEKDYKGVIPHIKKSLESASDDNLKRELLAYSCGSFRLNWRQRDIERCSAGI